jgi:hypothetical protein
MNKQAVLTIFAAFLYASSLVAQNAPAPSVKLVIRSGIVETQRGDSWIPAALGVALNAGDRVRTGSGSSAAIEIAPDKVVTLTENSEIRIGELTAAPAVQLEGGSMKVFSASDIQVGAKDTMLRTAERPLDLELGYDADQLNLTIFNGAVRNGDVVIHGRGEDRSVRTYSANGRRQGHSEIIVPNPTFYVYPYFLHGRPSPNAGKIVPPVVNNPTNPGFRPTQVVPPMSDPIRVPVTRP